MLHREAGVETLQLADGRANEAQSLSPLAEAVMMWKQGTYGAVFSLFIQISQIIELNVAV